MHFNIQLPTAIMNGSTRSIHWDVEVVKTDGGNEVRNTRWSTPLRSWEIAFNNAAIDSDNHAAVLQMWHDTEGGTHTFEWEDERTADLVKVRFDDDLTITNTVGPYHKIETFRIVEVRD